MWSLVAGSHWTLQASVVSALAELEVVGGDLVAVQTHRGHRRCRQRGFMVRKRVCKMMFKLKPAE